MSADQRSAMVPSKRTVFLARTPVRTLVRCDEKPVKLASLSAWSSTTQPSSCVVRLLPGGTWRPAPPSWNHLTT